MSSWNMTHSSSGAHALSLRSAHHHAAGTSIHALAHHTASHHTSAHHGLLAIHRLLSVHRLLTVHRLLAVHRLTAVMLLTSAAKVLLQLAEETTRFPALLLRRRRVVRIVLCHRRLGLVRLMLGLSGLVPLGSMLVFDIGRVVLVARRRSPRGRSE